MAVERKCSVDGTTIKWNNITILVKMESRGMSIHRYSAILIDGSWPDKMDLISLCCGDDPASPFHLGGDVFIDGNKASVNVYFN